MYMKQLSAYVSTVVGTKPAICVFYILFTEI